MGDLLPSRLGLDDAAKSTQKHCLITNIMEWLQSFAVYVSVIARKQPQHVPDLMGYQVLILEASSEYKNDCWMAYDRCFRQEATSQPQRSWSNIDTTLWLLAFSGQARANRCKFYFSLSHTSKDCELASVTRDNPPLPPSQYLYHQASTFTAAKDIVTSNTTAGLFAICALNPEAIDISHKAIFCPHHYSHRQLPSHQSQTTPTQPKPLMPTVYHGR